MNFFKEKQYERLIKPNSYFDPQCSPQACIKQLQKKDSNKKQCLKLLKKKTKNGFKIMRRLSFVHLLLIYSNNMFNMAETFTTQMLASSNEWLNENVIFPYYYFIKKIVASREIYTKIKSCKVQFDFEKIFYLHQIFIEMFKVVKKMPLVGRYYKEKHSILTTTFVQVIAVQAQKWYTYYKYSIQQVVNNPKVYLRTRGEEILFKSVLQQSLLIVNEEMKKLFLDKYFYPYGKGIWIKLFRPEDQNQVCVKVINGIVNDHRDTQRRNAHESLEKTLFPEDGKVDLEFYEKSLLPEYSKYEEIMLQEVENVNLPQFNETSWKIEERDTCEQIEKCEQV